jgi:hypothetical protein
MLTRILAASALVVLGILGAGAARADMVTWTVHGTVSVFTGPTQALQFDIASGESFTLTLLLDDDMPQFGTPSAVASGYNSGFVQGTLSFAGGSVPLTFGPSSSASLTVINDAFDFTPSGITQTDSLSATLMATVVNNTTRYTTFSGTRTQSTAPTVINGLDFPSESEVENMFLAPSATAFFFRTDIAGRHYTEVRGTISSVDVAPMAPVPLPSAAGLLSLALLGMSRFRRLATGRAPASSPGAA